MAKGTRGARSARVPHAELSHQTLKSITRAFRPQIHLRPPGHLVSPPGRLPLCPRLFRLRPCPYCTCSPGQLNDLTVSHHSFRKRAASAEMSTSSTRQRQTLSRMILRMTHSGCFSWTSFAKAFTMHFSWVLHARRSQLHAQAPLGLEHLGVHSTLTGYQRKNSPFGKTRKFAWGRTSPSSLPSSAKWQSTCRDHSHWRTPSPRRG